MPGILAGTWTIKPGTVIAGLSPFLEDREYTVGLYPGMTFPFGFKIDGFLYDPEQHNAVETSDGFTVQFVLNGVRYFGTSRLVIFNLPDHPPHTVILGTLGRPKPDQSQDEEIVSFTAIKHGGVYPGPAGC